MPGPQITQPVFPGSGGGGGGNPPPTVVQSAVNAAAAHSSQVTFPTAPAEGNLLLAFVSNQTATGVASGWTSIAFQSSGNDYGNVAWKIAGANESATQEPSPDTTNHGGVAIFEIANAGLGQGVALDGGGLAPSITIQAQKTAGLLLGAFVFADATAILSAMTGATIDKHIEGGQRATTSFIGTPAQGANVVAAVSAANADAKLLIATVY